jgi:hypothetical protein
LVGATGGGSDDIAVQEKLNSIVTMRAGKGYMDKRMIYRTRGTWNNNWSVQ